MRKVLIIAVLCLVALPVMAFEGQIGVSAGYQIFWNTSENADSQARNAIFAIDGANFFGSNGGFGVEYGIGMSDLTSMKVGDSTINDTEVSPGLAFRVGAAYRYGFTDMIGIVAGLGLNGNVDWGSDDSGWSTADTTTFMLSMYGKVAADFTFGPVRLDAGIGLGGPLYVSSTTKIGDVTTTTEPDVSGFFLTPFVSVSYVY